MNPEKQDINLEEIFGGKIPIQKKVSYSSYLSYLPKEYDVYDNYDIMTDMTFTFKDIFDKDTQANRIKWALLVLPTEKQDFHGLNYKQMSEVAGIDNIRSMGKIIERMKTSGDIQLYDKTYDNPQNKTYILSYSCQNDLFDTIKIRLDNEISELNRQKEKDLERKQLDEGIVRFTEECGKEDSKVWKLKDDCLSIDFMKLAEINPPLADLILDDFEITIDTLKKRLDEEGFDLFRGKEIEIVNIPKANKQEVRKTNTSHIGKVFTYDVEVVASTEILPASLEKKFECPSCGTIISVLQEPREEAREPGRCSCGRRGGFKVISNEMIDYKIVVVSDNPESLDDATSQKPKRLHLTNHLANIDETILEECSKLKVVATPFLKGDGATQSIDLKAISIEPQNELLVLNFSKEDIEEFIPFSRDNPLDKIKKESYDLSVEGFDDVKRSLILQQVGGVSKRLNNGKYRRGELHEVLIGDPGTAKSILASISRQLSPRCVVADANRGTSAGLTGTFEKNELLKRKVRTPGLIDSAKGGLMIWEELNEADVSVQATLKTPLESSEYSVNLATGKINRKVPFSFLATMNPKMGNYLDPNMSVLSQVPLNPALKTRIDLIWGNFTKSKDPHQVERILEKQDAEENISKERFRFFKKYLAYAKLQTTTIPKNIRELINGFCSGAIMNSDANFRIKDTLNRLVESLAKIELRKEATEKDFENARDLFLASLKSTSLKGDKVDWDRFVETSSTDISDINMVKRVYNSIKDENGLCLYKDLFDKSKLPVLRFKYILKVMIDKQEFSQENFKPEVKA